MTRSVETTSACHSLKDITSHSSLFRGLHPCLGDIATWNHEAPVSHTVRSPAWTRTKINGTRNRRAANYTTRE